MCIHCFQTSIYKFDSEKEFKEFVVVLYSKKSIQLIQNQQEYLDQFHSVYRCNYCSTDWWLSEPDMAWRGYFIKAIEAKQHIKNLKKSNPIKQIGCIAVFIIFVITVISMIYGNLA